MNPIFESEGVVRPNLWSITEQRKLSDAREDL